MGESSRILGTASGGSPRPGPGAGRSRRLAIALLGALAWAGQGSVDAQESKRGNDATEAADDRGGKAVDPRFGSPRATVRTFLIAMNLAEDDPGRIEEAIACLDPAGLSADRRDDGRVAFELEFVLRSINVPTMVIPDRDEGTTCQIGEGKEIRLGLRRMPDGRWLFDGETLKALPSLRLALWQRAVAAGPAKEADDVPAGFRSPYAAFRTYVAAMKAGDLDRAAECLDLDEIPGPARGVAGRELAFKVKEILDRNRFVIFQDLPDTSVGVPLEALVVPQGQVTLERKATGPRKGQWLLNRATVRSVDRLYEVYKPRPLVPELAAIVRAGGRTPRTTPAEWLRRRIPAPLKTRIGPAGAWSLAGYQWLGLGLLIAAALPLYRLASGASSRLLRRLAEWRGVPADDRELRTWSRPIGWWAVAWLLVEGVAVLDLGVGAAGPLLAVLVPVRELAAALAAFQLVDPILRLVAGPAIARHGASTLTAMGYPVLSLVMKIGVVAWGLARLLDLFEFDVGTVLAGLGIGGLAFALAAQDTLKNFFGSLMLIADRTFRVGDLVQIGGNEGVVESVGLRTTRIRGLDDSLLTIPNSDLTTAHVTNFGARRHRRFQARVVVPFGTPTSRLVDFRDGLSQLVRDRPGVRPGSDEVAINDLGGNGVEILIRASFDVHDGHDELVARDGLILEVVRLADRLGLSFDKAPRPAPG